MNVMEVTAKAFEKNNKLLPTLKAARYKILVGLRPLQVAKDSFGIVITELKAEGLITEQEWKELML